MNQTQPPFAIPDKNPVVVILAAVTAIAALYVYFLIFAGFAFVDSAMALIPRAQMPWFLMLLGGGGVLGCVMVAKRFTPARGQVCVTKGFLGCLAVSVLTLLAKREWALLGLALPVGFTAGWTAVSLSLCLRPTLHGERLGAWCGLGIGLAYAICNQPPVFEASLAGKIAFAALAVGLGAVASLTLRGEPSRPSSLPDYELQAASGWVAVLFALVFLDTLVFFIIQKSVVLKQLSWDTPLVLQGNAFIHICAAFVAGLVLDQRWLGITTLAALVTLIFSSIMLGLDVENFPLARILYVTAVSIYATTFIYLVARSGRPNYVATVFAVSGWMAVGLALIVAVSVNARRVPGLVIFLVLLVGLAGLGARFLWLRRVHEMEAERAVLRKPA